MKQNKAIFLDLIRKRIVDELSLFKILEVFYKKTGWTGIKEEFIEMVMMDNSTVLVTDLSYLKDTPGGNIRERQGLIGIQMDLYQFALDRYGK